MPRNSDLFQYLDSVTKYVLVTTTPGNTTTTEAIIGDGTETGVDVAAITNFTAADPCFIIGTGGYELVTIGTPATTPMPVTRPLRVPQDSGAQFREAVAIDLGHIGPDGVSWTPSQSLTDIFAATARSAVSSLAQPATIAFTIPLRYKSGLDLQAAAGVPEGEAGDGTAAATPYSVHVGQSNIGTQTPGCFRLQGRMESGDICQLDLLGARLSVNFTDNRGGTDPGVLVIGGTITGASQFIWTP